MLLEAPFSCLGSVYNILAKHGAATAPEEYTDSGLVRLLLTADADAVDSIICLVVDATGGQVKAHKVEGEIGQ